MDATTPRALDEGGLFEDDADLAENQEFDRSVAEASDSLQRGDAGGARQLLEKALRYKPRNQRARNLLGLSLFKLGELEKAEAIYRGLIEDHPADPTLRVNLGLVFLKLGAANDAARCFETTLDLSPDHRKAQNYLGLALAQTGEVGRARECFLKAGNSAMAQRMEQQLAATPLREVAQEAQDTLEEARPFRPATEEKPAPAEERAPASTWVATAPAAAAAIGRVALGTSSAGSGPAANEPPEVEEPSELAAYTTTRRLSIPNREGGFGIGSTEVLVQVRGEMLTRLDGLVASWGQLSLKPELKRFRGRPTDKPFGEAPGACCALSEKAVSSSRARAACSPRSSWATSPPTSARKCCSPSRSRSCSRTGGCRRRRDTISTSCTCAAGGSSCSSPWRSCPI